MWASSISYSYTTLTDSYIANEDHHIFYSRTHRVNAYNLFLFCLASNVKALRHHQEQ